MSATTSLSTGVHGVFDSREIVWGRICVVTSVCGLHPRVRYTEELWRRQKT